MRKNKVLEYISAKKYYLALIGCLAITLVAVSIIYNKDQKYEEIANLNDAVQEQSLVENPNEIFETAANDNEAIEAVNPAPQISIHQEIVPEATLQDTTEVEGLKPEEIPAVVPDEILNADEENTSDMDEDDAMEVFQPIIEVEQPNLTFDVNQRMTMPINGEIAIAFSVDTPVYFKTLDQYKMSKGLYITSEVGTEVKASADGLIEKIEKDPYKGNIITIYHGNGYKTIYGQLKEDMNVKEGDVVNKGTIIGYLNEPTSYYTLEGPNLYFEVIDNGKSVDPETFLQQ